MRKFIAMFSVATLLCCAVAGFTACAEEECVHDYREDTQQTVAATCYSDGTKYLVCSICGDEKTETDTARPDHNFSGEWVSNLNGHYKKCINEGCTQNDAVNDHNWKDCEEITPPTDVTDGEMKIVCEDCGYESTRVLPSNSHVKGDLLVFSSDSATHWYPCVNTAHTDCDFKYDEKVHEYATELTEQCKPASCKEDGKKVTACDCGAIKEEIISKTTVEHTWNKGEHTKPATCFENGEITYSCNVCGETKTEETDKTEHSFGGEWISDSNGHYLKCQNNGCTEISEKETHVWEEETVPPTFYEDGLKTSTCTVCGRNETETVARENSITVNTDDENWKFGTVNYHFPDDEDNSEYFTFSQITDKNENNDGFVKDGTELKNTWFCGASFDEFICVAYTFEEDVNAEILISFKGVGGDDGILSEYSLRIGYNQTPEWGDSGTEYTVNKTHGFKAGDTVYFIFKHEKNGWDQGNYSITINRVEEIQN